MKANNNFSSFERISLNVISQWLRTIFFIGVNFFLVAYVIGKVGKEFYGAWAGILSIIGYLTLLDVGMNTSIQYHISRYRAQNDRDGMVRMYVVSYFFYVPAAVLAFFFVWVFSLYYGDIFPRLLPLSVEQSVLALRWVSLAMFLTMLNIPIQGTLLAFQMHFVCNSIQVISLTVRTVTVLICFNFLEISLQYLGLSFFLAVFISLLLGRLALYKVEPQLRIKRIDNIRKSAKELFSYGGHSFLWTICNVLILRSGPILANWFVGPGAATSMYVGMRIVQSFRSLINAAGSVFIPVFSSVHALQDKVHMRRLVIQSTRFSGLLSLAGAVCLIIFGKEFINLWLGEEYDVAYKILVVTTLAMLAPWCFNTATAALMGMGALKILTTMTICRLVWSILLSIIAANIYGVVGLAAGLAGGTSLAVLVFVPFFISRKVEISLWNYLVQSFASPIIISIIIGMIAFLTKRCWPPDDILTLLFQGIGMTVLMGIVSFQWGLEPQLRTLVRIKFFRIFMGKSTF